MTGFGFGSASPNGNGSATEFLSMLPPPNGDLAEYDNTRPHDQQPASVPQVFRDAMSVREEVYGEQGIPIEAEFDEDDHRSWHWVVYASVASTASSPPKDLRTDTPTDSNEEARRSSASASRLPVGTIRLIPAPHAPNKYIQNEKVHGRDKHTDADPPAGITVDTTAANKHPTEPYVKLGRLAVLSPYRKLGLAKLLINAALEHASKHPETIYHPPSPTTMELASLRGNPAAQDAVTWNGLVMIHAQANLKALWGKYGFAEELVNDKAEVEIHKEPHWVEEGIEHVGMWKRVKIENGRL